MNPAMRAFDYREAILRFAKTPYGNEAFNKIFTSPDGRGADYFVNMAAALTGDLYYVDGAARQLIDYAADTLPLDLPVPFTLLPTPSGFLCLPRPIRTVGMWGSDVSEPLDIWAISWGTHTLDVGQKGLRVGSFTLSQEPPTEAMATGVTFAFWLRLTYTHTFFMPAAWNLSVGNSLASLQALEPSEDFLNVAKFLVAFWSFVQQRILVASKVVADRATQRRIKTPPQEPPAVRVVLLRAADRPRKEGESQPVDWHYRWLVRGHWRSQWYPTHGEHRRIWVLPHIKGPEHRPLRKPEAILFAVQR